MTFGRRDPFTYFESQSCGCVQIAPIPNNRGDYYPREYFAFKSQHRLAPSRIRAPFDGHRLEVGRRIERVVFDSTERQRLGSKSWRQDIARLESADAREAIEA